MRWPSKSRDDFFLDRQGGKAIASAHQVHKTAFSSTGRGKSRPQAALKHTFPPQAGGNRVLRCFNTVFFKKGNMSLFRVWQGEKVAWGTPRVRLMKQPFARQAGGKGHRKLFATSTDRRKRPSRASQPSPCTAISSLSRSKIPSKYAKPRVLRCFKAVFQKGNLNKNRPKIISHAPHKGKGLYGLSANHRHRREKKGGVKCCAPP